MTASVVQSVEDQVREAFREVLELVVRQGQPIVCVNSPPGAGKTQLVEEVAAAAILEAGMRVAVITPRAEQGYELLRRIARNFPIPGIQVLQSEQRDLPSDLARHPQIRPAVSRVRDLLPGPSLVVGTAAKFLASQPDFPGAAFDLLICDEAYQLAYKDFAPLVPISTQHLLVGDPGQLPPIISVPTARFEAARSRIHWPSPREMLRRFPGLPLIRLPASHRLRQDTVDYVQPAFYRDMPFVSAVNETDRRVHFSALGVGGAIDHTLDLLEGGASIVALMLPEREFAAEEIDEELADLMASLAARMLQRHAEYGTRPLVTADIGIVDAHVASGAAVGRHLRARGLSTDELVVQTPEIWQGRQRPVMIVKHPLSGQSRLDHFALEAGRWCVMLSRHQAACIIVGRQGIGEALERHHHDCAERPLGAQDVQWEGWWAHKELWRRLSDEGRIVQG